MNQTKFVTEFNCERIVAVFCEEYEKFVHTHGDQPVTDKFRLHLLDMLTKAFVAYAMFMGFDLKTTQEAVAGFWADTHDFVIEVPMSAERH